MALPPLDDLLTIVPAYELTASLGEITPALGQPGAGAPSHIVVIDQAHRPLGAIALGRLWAAHSVWGLSTATAEPQLKDCQAWLEPVVAVAVSQLLESSAIAELGAIARSLPTPTLVAIDANGQYLGVISPTRLLGWLVSEAAGGHVDEAEPSDQQAWVLELSHALKTPITTLLGLSTLLLDSRVGALSDRQFRYVSLMRQAIRKLTGLVNLLLDWMRLESEQIDLHLERVNLQPLAEGLLPSFLTAQPDIQASADWGDQFTLHLADPTAWVMADSLRLRQSLHYGLGYLVAQGANPGGLVVEPWGDWLSLTLWSAHPLGATPFPAPLPGKPQMPQSLDGLGLALARRLSQIHGGELSCLSTPTWGSRLTLLLPLPPDLPEAAPTPGTVPVLVASASDAVLDRIYGSLRNSPYRLVVAPSCHHLVDMQQRLNPLCTLIHWPSLADAPEPGAARLALVQSQNQTVILTPADERELIPAPTVQYLPLATIAQNLRPTLDQLCARAQAPMPPTLPPQGLTMLLLRSPEAAAGVLTQSLQAWLQRHRCRLLQVDDLAQANLLSRVWQPQAIILDGVEPVSVAYLEALANQPDLAQLPLVTFVDPADGGVAQALGLTLRVCPDLLTQAAPQAVAQLLAAIAPPSPPYPP
jgi:signal transduction histidine kinase